MAEPKRSGGYVRSVLSEIVHTLTHKPSFAGSDTRSVRMLMGVFVAVFVILAVVAYVYVTQQVPPAPPRIAFSTPQMLGGNATFNVTQVLDGPYPASELTLNLSVNDISAQATMGLSGQNVSVTVGSGANAVTYFLAWFDLDHDGAVSVGDVIWVRGATSYLPPLSTYILTLVWTDGSIFGSTRWVSSSE